MMNRLRSTWMLLLIRACAVSPLVFAPLLPAGHTAVAAELFPLLSGVSLRTPQSEG